jgi:chromate transporter
LPDGILGRDPNDLDYRISIVKIEQWRALNLAIERTVSSSRSVPAAAEVLRVFLKLGLSSFGGPIAHLGYFRDEFVVRRKWLDESNYVDIVALCQFLPGPASSQVGITIGILRAGLPGAFCAWLGFTAPSAVALILFGYGVTVLGDPSRSAWLHGLMIVAAAVVAQAVWGMARSLCPDRERVTLAIGAAVLALVLPLALPSTVVQVGTIILGGIIGLFWLPAAPENEVAHLAVPLGRGTAIVALGVFFILLIGLPVLASASGDQAVRLVDSFYRSGSLVFGGGHVVLPLLQQEVVPRGWISNDAFLAGYGAAQAVPGPLFTFAAYLGSAMAPRPNGWLGGLICLIAIFLPSFLLLVGALPFWNDLRSQSVAQSGLKGINAAVVGLLLAALYMPIWTSTITRPFDFATALVAFLLLVFWKVPPWVVVMLGALVTGGAAWIA